MESVIDSMLDEIIIVSENNDSDGDSDTCNEKLSDTDSGTEELLVI